MDDGSGKDFKRLSIYFILVVPFEKVSGFHFNQLYLRQHLVVTVSSSGEEDFEKFSLSF